MLRYVCGRHGGVRHFNVIWIRSRSAAKGSLIVILLRKRDPCIWHSLNRTPRIRNFRMASACQLTSWSSTYRIQWLDREWCFADTYTAIINVYNYLIVMLNFMISLALTVRANSISVHSLRVCHEGKTRKDSVHQVASAIQSNNIHRNIRSWLAWRSTCTRSCR